MKIRIFLILLGISVSAGLTAGNVNDSVSYAFGIQIANDLVQNEIVDEIDLNLLIEAINDVKLGKPKMNEEQSLQILRNYMLALNEKKRKANEAAGLAFLEKNAKNPDVVVLPSGLQYKILKKGKLLRPKVTDTVEVHYKGLLVDSTEFESSAKMAGAPVRFMLGDVISGWKEGLQYIAEEGRIILYIPPKLAYGDRSMPGSPIPPSSTLIFEIELLKIIPGSN
ncbi:MAG: FKBP-type peptidyl-prolyl cis-trans isomerase [Prevotellaceae bacterium]|jgi:FKBP-type peptidyl-prolyl cis-trans isomerase FklB|nr:FKBP-type peptidyl-prolyl cis-trans isomerase [Prevotellaceae bacterium]